MNNRVYTEIDDNNYFFSDSKTAYTKISHRVRELLHKRTLSYVDLYDSIINDKHFYKRFNIYNRHDLEDFKEVVRETIAEMVFNKELNVLNGHISINECYKCTRDGGFPCSVSLCDCCKEFTPHITKYRIKED